MKHNKIADQFSAEQKKGLLESARFAHAQPLDNAFWAGVNKDAQEAAIREFHQRQLKLAK